MPSAAAPVAPLAYFWGDDAYGIEAAVEGLRTGPAFAEGPPERWRAATDPNLAARTLAELRERALTGSLFGSGTLAIVANPGPLVRRNEDRAALIETISAMAPGNGVAFAVETDSGVKEPPQKPLAEAVRAAGGDVRRFEAPREGALAAWIEARARERDLKLAAGAAKELATRVGGFVREGDVDRREQGRIAVGELEKLALYALERPITAGDVQALVSEAVPGSMWAFVDAVGMRQGSRATALLERLLSDTPGPVLLAVLHRRLRELIEVLDRLDSGETPGSLVRSMRLVPFRAESLARQARQWSPDDLDAALDGLLELDATVKGVPGSPSGDAQHRLAFTLWLTDRIAPGG
ncbi:MAG: DNA polymerase III subunit delta [Chloroflexi bacterium]|nr:DNA polymerase III subunit delta [Chloroflexota bacterium]